MSDPQDIHSRDNPLLVRLRRLARDPAAYRKLGQVWLEGDHLAHALLAHGGRPSHCLIAASAWDDPALRELAASAQKTLRLPDPLFASLSALESPSRIGFVWPLPPAAPLRSGLPSVVLDRLQDAGNVGSVLRSAAAFGFAQVLAIKGTAALWSPKVLRAGMGAHFALHLCEGLDAAALDRLALPLLATGSHAQQVLHRSLLPWPCAWVFGHEGQGVAGELAARCELQLRIAQPGGEESLNVAAAAAICLHESQRRRWP